MKRLYLLLFAFTFVLIGRAQPPGYVRTVFRQSVRVDTSDSRKLLIVLLPEQPDTGIVGQLLRFETKHGSQVRIIAMLAPGSGASVAANANHSNAYASLPAAGILLTEGMAETDSIAGPRSGILKYLSHKNRNRKTDVFAEGGKYFLSEKGRMFAQLGKTTSLDSRLADHIVQTKVPGEDRIH